MISETVKGISDTITNESLINLDYADMRAVMNCGGVAVMLFGESKLTARRREILKYNTVHHIYRSGP